MFKPEDVGEIPGRLPLSAAERRAFAELWNAEAAAQAARAQAEAALAYRRRRAIAYRDELGEEPGDFIRTLGDVLDVLIAQVEAMRRSGDFPASDEFSELLSRVAHIKSRHPAA